MAEQERLEDQSGRLSSYLLRRGSIIARRNFSTAGDLFLNSPDTLLEATEWFERTLLKHQEPSRVFDSQLFKDGLLTEASKCLEETLVSVIEKFKKKPAEVADGYGRNVQALLTFAFEPGNRLDDDHRQISLCAALRLMSPESRPMKKFLEMANMAENKEEAYGDPLWRIVVSHIYELAEKHPDTEKRIRRMLGNVMATKTGSKSFVPVEEGMKEKAALILMQMRHLALVQESPDRADAFAFYFESFETQRSGESDSNRFSEYTAGIVDTLILMNPYGALTMFKTLNNDLVNKALYKALIRVPRKDTDTILSIFTNHGVLDSTRLEPILADENVNPWTGRIGERSKIIPSIVDALIFNAKFNPQRVNEQRTMTPLLFRQIAELIQNEPERGLRCSLRPSSQELQRFQRTRIVNEFISKLIGFRNEDPTGDYSDVRALEVMTLAYLFVNPPALQAGEPYYGLDQRAVDELSKQVTSFFAEELIKANGDIRQPIWKIFQLIAPLWPTAMKEKVLESYRERATYTNSQLIEGGKWMKLCNTFGLKNPAYPQIPPIDQEMKSILVRQTLALLGSYEMLDGATRPRLLLLAIANLPSEEHEYPFIRQAFDLVMLYGTEGEKNVFIADIQRLCKQDILRIKKTEQPVPKLILRNVNELVISVRSAVAQVQSSMEGIVKGLIDGKKDLFSPNSGIDSITNSLNPVIKKFNEIMQLNASAINKSPFDVIKKLQDMFKTPSKIGPSGLPQNSNFFETYMTALTTQLANSMSREQIGKIMETLQRANIFQAVTSQAANLAKRQNMGQEIVDRIVLALKDSLLEPQLAEIQTRLTSYKDQIGLIATAQERMAEINQSTMADMFDRARQLQLQLRDEEQRNAEWLIYSPTLDRQIQQAQSNLRRLLQTTITLERPSVEDLIGDPEDRLELTV